MSVYLIRIYTQIRLKHREATLFGHKIPAPILFAPIGINKLYTPKGELVPAKIAGELGLPVSSFLALCVIVP